MATPCYQNLQDRLTTLRQVFLPSQFDPTGSYEDEVYEMTRAYTALSHAELEYYFEEMGKTIANKALREWNQNRVTTKTLVALVAYSQKDPCPIQEHVGGNHATVDLQARISSAHGAYIGYVNGKNNGIKEKNILSLFLPLGIHESEIPADLLVDVENYGSQRGAIVHSTRTRNVQSPEDALQATTEIMQKLQPFDTLLSNYL